MIKKKEKVVVAMSGGLDSSVAAALLKRAGFEVVGVFMKFWSPSLSDGSNTNRCCSPESEVRARMVAKKLGIPFYVVNFEKEFKEKVVDYFVAEYVAGRTPNPCVVCNKEIKLGLLFKKARTLGADFVATGHYVKKVGNGTQCRIYAAKDKNKDQSYFLWQLNHKQFKNILFPIADYSKNEVRKLAARFKLPLKNIPESMEICFISGTIGDFLSDYLEEREGDIKEFSTGKILGHHSGLWMYTIGQRKGIGLSGGPWYALRKDYKSNSLLVTKNKNDLLSDCMNVKMIKWVSEKEPKMPLKARVKIRYRHEAALAVISRESKAKFYKVQFMQPQPAITPGQSAVFYIKKELIGGGIII